MAGVRVLKRRVRAVQARAAETVEPVRRRMLGTASETDLREALSELGVVAGATVLAHVSMNEVRRAAPAVSPLAMTKLVEDLLGPEGTLLMPTFPFLGYEMDYVQRTPNFDVIRTP